MSEKEKQLILEMAKELLTVRLKGRLSEGVVALILLLIPAVLNLIDEKIEVKNA